MDPIDRAVTGATAVVTGLILALMAGDRWLGDSQAWVGGRPRVREFSWQNQQVGARDRAFVLTFNRPVDRDAVEANLTIEPPLPGKWSWVGRRAAYTLKGPIPYGTTYQLDLTDAREQFGGGDRLGRKMQPFAVEFQSRDRVFAYIGTVADERGRLVAYNLTRQEKQVLTPPGLAVTDFQPYPEGDRILFGAIDTRQAQAANLASQLFQTTTGLGTDPAGQLELVLDTQTHQNLQFSLADGGEAIVVQRASRTDARDVGLWLLRTDAPAAPPHQIEGGRDGGEFRVTPDGKAAAIARGEGIALVSLAADSNPPEFLPEFGRVLAFAPDGRAAAMVDFNVENADRRFLQSLVHVTNDGRQQLLLDTEGSILGCEYAPTTPTLYCALTRVVETPADEIAGETADPEIADIDPKTQPFPEELYLAEIDTETGTVEPIALPPGTPEVSFSLSPDGLAVLLDRLPAEVATLEPDAASWLWLWLPRTGDLEAIPIQGRQPQWLP